MKKIDYQPIIFGTLCDGPCKADAWLARRLREELGECVLLPFSVERRHMKNVVLTMRLMDIMGLVIAEGHRKAIARHANRLDASARASGRADVLVKRGGSFVAYDSVAAACAAWCSHHQPRARRATAIGTHPLAGPVLASLKSLGCAVSRGGLNDADIVVVAGNVSKDDRSLAASLQELRAGAVVIDLANCVRTSTRRSRLSLHQLETDARRLRVELLTSAIRVNTL